jgi:hypothetical protein
MTDEQIYKYLCGNIDIGDMYLSPIPSKYRKPDTNNSFGLYLKDDGVIRWKDYGLSDQAGYRAIHLYQYMMGFPLDGKGFYAAKNSAERELKKYFANKPQVELLKSKHYDKKNLCPFVEYDSNFADFELEYWDRFSITKEDLVPENIFSLKSLKWLDTSKVIKSEPNDPAFIYIFKLNPISWKIYRPLNKDQKFRQWNIEGVIEGVNEGVKLKDAIMLSSTKDRLVVKKALKGYNYDFGNATSENSFVNLIQKKDIFGGRKLFVYDADDAGFNASVKCAMHLNGEYFDMRGKLDGQKDFSDYVDKQRGKHSYQELRSLLIENLKL